MAIIENERPKNLSKGLEHVSSTRRPGLQGYNVAALKAEKANRGDTRRAGGYGAVSTGVSLSAVNKHTSLFNLYHAAVRLQFALFINTLLQQQLPKKE